MDQYKIICINNKDLENIRTIKKKKNTKISDFKVGFTQLTRIIKCPAIAQYEVLVNVPLIRQILYYIVL